MALKRIEPGVRFSGFKVSPDEMDMTMQYTVMHPSVDPVWFGTSTVGTQTQAKALVVTNIRADYPRNLVGAVAAAAGSVAGGTWVVNGKNQFGATIQESVAIAPATGGGTVAGTKIFAQVSSGTFTFGTGDPGNGTPRLGVAIGTAATLQHLFGLPDKIASTADVKNLLWINNGTSTTVNGGSIGAYVGTANHTFKGTAVVAVTDRFVVSYRSSFNSEAEQVHNL